MTTRTTTDTLETVQHYDQPAGLQTAVLDHMTAEQAAGITGQRGYLIRVEHGGQDWIIESFPAGPGTARKPGLYDGDGRALQIPQPAAEDFPCCGPNGEGH
jgi:hypothetical protein